MCCNCKLKDKKGITIGIESAKDGEIADNTSDNANNGE